jgi:hypothetical protein
MREEGKKRERAREKGERGEKEREREKGNEGWHGVDRPLPC